MHAAYTDSLVVAIVLIEGGCNMNSVNAFGDSALCIASRSDFLPLVELLLAKSTVLVDKR